MKHLVTLAAVAAASLAVATPAMAQRGPVYGQDEEARFDAAQQRFEREYDQFQQALERYRAYKSRPVVAPPPPPPRGGYYDPRDEEYYDAARDYRAPPPGYQERVLTQDDRIYRGRQILLQALGRHDRPDRGRRGGRSVRQRHCRRALEDGGHAARRDRRRCARQLGGPRPGPLPLTRSEAPSPRRRGLRSFPDGDSS